MPGRAGLASVLPSVMVASSVARFASQYRPAALARLPPQLDPSEYQWSPEKRRAEAERVALRSRIKRDFFLRLNDPRRTQLIAYKERLKSEGRYEEGFRTSY